MVVTSLFNDTSKSEDVQHDLLPSKAETLIKMLARGCQSSLSTRAPPCRLVKRPNVSDYESSMAEWHVR